jgi:hypothetical protein
MFRVKKQRPFLLDDKSPMATCAPLAPKKKNRRGTHGTVFGNSHCGNLAAIRCTKAFETGYLIWQSDQ